MNVLVYSIPATIVPAALTDLASIHYGLQSISVSGIPMKGKDAHDSQRGVYDVPILFPADAHFPSLARIKTRDQVQEYQLGSGDCRKPHEMNLRWKSIDRKTNPDTLSSKCVHRITTVSLYAHSSVCLTNHLLSGKPVALVTLPAGVETPPGAVPSTSPLPISHMLLAHGGDLYLHCLRTFNFNLADFNVASYSLPTNEYRISDFKTLMDSNILRIPRGAGIPKSNLKGGIVATDQLEKQTRYFPYLERETMLSSSNQTKDLQVLLNPVKEFFSQSKHDQDHIETCRALVTRLSQSCASNEVRMFKTLADKPQQRMEAYEKLWSELQIWARMFADPDSSDHQQMISLIERLWPESARNGGTSTTAATISPRPMEIDTKTTKLEKKPSPSVTTPKIMPTSNAPSNMKQEDPNDVWGQAEQARRHEEEMDWKKADASQKPVQDIKEEKMGGRKRKSKPRTFESQIDQLDRSSVLFAYWSKHRKSAPEFDRRSDDVTSVMLYDKNDKMAT
eukprot:TRINITY_DN9940_c0_g1_i1.p1 TRINITY_DN9940_c0_g1~~TRINITY_DN9940_c0_g1_i1.p1  ORF type:complete len:507 (+),score=132.70 TRINITY_DN9940_c0_g1_i1:268-1788(+)